MTYPQINAVICDMNGLFRIWHNAGARQAETLAGLPAGTIDRYAYQHPNYRLARVGVLTDDEWAADVAVRIALDYGNTAAEMLAHWRADRGEPVADMINILRSLRQLVPVAVLSNCTDRLPEDLRLHGIEFDHIFSSASLGADKPSPLAYRAALEIMGRNPGETLYVDDEPSFVTAAANVGLVARLFRDPAQFTDQLTLHGLSVNNMEPTP